MPQINVASSNISPELGSQDKDCGEILCDIKTTTALEAGESRVLGMPGPVGT